MLAGRYRPLHRIAHGEEADTWEGHDEVLARPVALRVLHAHLASDPTHRERFRRDAVAAARLAHRNIVGTFDTGEDADSVFVVMDLVRGRTLRSVLDAQGALPPQAATVIAAQVAAALEEAHGAGLVHRRLSASDIVLGDSEVVPDVKVSGFGLPSQLLDGDSDGRAAGVDSDLYALGSLLYEMLTGRPVAAGPDGTQGRVVPPRRLRHGIPRSLEAVTLRALAAGTADGFAAATEVREALEAVDVGPDDAVAAFGRVSTPPRGQPPVPVRRGGGRLVRAGAAAALATLLTTLVVVLVSSGGTSDARRDVRPADRAAIAITAVRSFDPEGRDRRENEAQARLVVDGNPATTWETDRYRSPEFGRLKSGVGLELQLGAAHRLDRVAVSSPTTGWSASVFVSDAPGARLSDWGEPVRAVNDIRGGAEFVLGGAEGRSVLLWITRLGDGNRVQISEITVTG